MSRQKEIIHTDGAPAAIGTYSQAVKTGTTVYLSGQIPLHPDTMELEQGDFAACAKRAFSNLKAVTEAAGGGLQDIVKLNIYLTDLNNFPILNEVMASFFQAPYPARSTVEVSRLPKDVPLEMDAVMELSGS